VTRIAIDTNVLAYAEDTNGAARKCAALDILSKLSSESTLIPVQVLGELFNVLVKKARRSRRNAERAVLSWGDAFPLIDTSSSVSLAAMMLANDHQLGIWDAVILAAAADAGCRLLLSEDLQEGFTWSGVTVTNPFSATRHPLLEAMLH
jgi:predicted nucleic acid-binding protein